jgi:5'-nucleotidase
VRVVGGDAPDAAEPDNDLEASVLAPLRQDVATLRDARAADSAVALDATAAALGAGETNFGDLLADAAFLAARSVASTFGAPAPAAGLVEAGVVDADRLVAAGTLTRGDLFELAPSDRLLAVLAAVPAERLKALLEHAVAEGGGERFLQVANLAVELDLSQPARAVDPDGTVTEPGARVRRIVVGASQVLVEDGAVVAGAPALALAVTDTLARGEGGFPIDETEFRIVGVDLRQALDNLLLARLGGSIRAADYPEGGAGRITVTGAP